MLTTLKGAATAVKTAQLRVATWLSVTSMSLMAAGEALAQEDANVRGALKANQSALTAVKESSFTGDGVKDSADNVTNALLYGAGAFGIALVIVGIYQLWKHQSDGEQARGSAAQPIAMILIGGLMTIPAIMTAVAPTIFVGAEGN